MATPEFPAEEFYQVLPLLLAMANGDSPSVSLFANLDLMGGIQWSRFMGFRKKGMVQGTESMMKYG